MTDLLKKTAKVMSLESLYAYGRAVRSLKFYGMTHKSGGAAPILSATYVCLNHTLTNVRTCMHAYIKLIRTHKHTELCTYVCTVALEFC